MSQLLSALSVVLYLSLASSELLGQQAQLPPWVRNDPPEPLALISVFLVEQDELSRLSPARGDLSALTARIGVSATEMTVVIAAAKTHAAALRAIPDSRTFKIDGTLFAYERSRQDVIRTDAGNLKKTLSQAGWQRLLSHVVETALDKQRSSLRGPAGTKPVFANPPADPR